MSLRRGNKLGFNDEGVIKVKVSALSVEVGDKVLMTASKKNRSVI